MSHEAEDLLRQVSFLRRLAPADCLRVAAVTRVRTVERGETLFTEGEEPDTICVIARGRVKVFKTTPSGKQVILGVFGPGDPLGAVAAYEGHPYPATAAAIEHSTCLMIPRQVFFALLEEHPSLVRGLLAGLNMRLVELTNRVTDLSAGRVESRLARLLLKMAHEQGRPDRGGVFIPASLSRQELADLTGTTIETSIRIMSRWNKEGIVRTDRDGFVVLNEAELETLSQT